MLIIINTQDKNSKKLPRTIKNTIFKKQPLKFIALLILILVLGTLLIKSYSTFKDKNLALSKFNNNFNENALTICIDPGHGDWDDGATGMDGALEKNINLNVSLKLGELLQNAGFNVVYTRNSDDLSLSDKEMDNLCQRVNISKENNADLFISIHCNTTDESSSYNGIETWYNPKESNNEVFASIVQTELSNLNYTQDRGIKSDSELVVLAKNDTTSVLVELGFLSNPSDEKFLNSSSGQTQCAKALFTAIKNASKAIFPSVESDT